MLLESCAPPSSRDVKLRRNCDMIHQPTFCRINWCSPRCNFEEDVLPSVSSLLGSCIHSAFNTGVVVLVGCCGHALACEDSRRVGASTSRESKIALRQTWRADCRVSRSTSCRATSEAKASTMPMMCVASASPCPSCSLHTDARALRCSSYERMIASCILRC